MDLWKKNRFSHGLILAILYCLVFHSPLLAFSQENATKETVSSASPASEATSTPVPKELSPVEWLSFIKQKRALLTVELKELAKSADVESATQTADFITQKRALLESIDSTLSQQVAALEENLSLQSQKKQYLDSMKELDGSSNDEPDSFIELDRAREEFNVEQKRRETFDTKIRRAESSLEQVKKAFSEKKQFQEELIAAYKSEENKEFNPNDTYPLQIAVAEVRLASETIRLRNFESQNEKTAKSVYETHVLLLQKRVEKLQNNVVFTYDELEEQKRRIEKEEYDVNRDLTRTSDLQNIAKNRLSTARDKLAQASADEQRKVEAEVEARRLESEAINIKLEHLTKYLEMLSDRKKAWQRRYSVFNFTIQNQNLDEWEVEAGQTLDALDKEERLQMLLLGDWQNRLLTINNKLSNIDRKTDPTARYLDLQQKAVQQIVELQQTYQTRIENSRRLFEKLSAELKSHTTQITFNERLDIVLSKEFYQNSLRLWAYSLLCALCIAIILLFVRWVLVTRLKRYAEEDSQSFAHGFAISVRRTRILFILIISVYFASQLLALPLKTKAVIVTLAKVALVIQGAYWTSFFLRTWIYRYLARKMRRDQASLGALSIFNFIGQLAIWSLAILLTLQNIGIDVTALVAGLGVGGVAVALALQNVLGDLFSSLSIVLDRPFVIGDFIIFDNFTYLGTVEHIGIKTTRIRSLTGEQIICSNSDLLNTRIRNFKRMRERRVIFQIGVVYQTTYERLQKIPEILKQSIEAQENVRFDRAHFAKYGDFSLNFEIVYYVLDADYNIYMDIQQTINLVIFKRFKEEGIEFAYPTQSLYVEHKPWNDEK